MTIAFWQHDAYPYLLGGRVESVEPEGTVTVEGYDGMRFTPDFVLGEPDGETLLETLDDLNSDYRMHRRALDATFNRRAKSAIKKYKPKREQG